MRGSQVMNSLFSYGRVLLSCTRRLHSMALTHSTYGNPEDVVSLKKIELDPVASSEVLIKLLKAPVNPSDINKIQGTYPEKIKPGSQGVCGNEGVGEVVEVGTSVQSLAPGDLVIPALTGVGTWQTYGVYPEHLWMKVMKEVPLNLAASLIVNPCTAYRMLEDFVALKEGDVIVQNAANSALGLSVIQLAALRGVNTINIIRDRPDFDKVSQRLLELGGSVVLTEEQAGSRMSGEIVKEFGAPQLAFNGVGDKSAANLVKFLREGGTMVTYGGMSRKPVTISTGSLIFKDCSVVGYWNTRWLKNNLKTENHEKMIEDLCLFGIQGKLRPPVFVEHSLKDYNKVFQDALKPFSNTKLMFSFHSAL